jgi:LytS/YehU family sensor histidine kinase
MHKLIFPLINSAFNYHPVVTSRNIWWTSIASGLFSAPKVIAVAIAIKLLKRWYLKQKEKERLEKEKLIADLQLLKAQIHPEFLFTTLDSVYAFALKDNSRAAILLLKLSDLLSYILYECDKALVPLDKEIKIIKDYMALEKARMGNRLEIDIAVKGEARDKMISPLLLLPFIENSFSYCYNKNLETCWINLELRIENNELTMKLINGKSVASVPASINGHGLTNVQKRLEIMYPGNYEVKTNIEPEIVMTWLKISLQESLMKEVNRSDHPQQKTYATI